MYQVDALFLMITVEPDYTVIHLLRPHCFIDTFCTVLHSSIQAVSVYYNLAFR